MYLQIHAGEGEGGGGIYILKHFRVLIFSNSFGVLVIVTAYWSVFQKDIKRKNKAGGSRLSDDKGKILLL